MITITADKAANNEYHSRQISAGLDIRKNLSNLNKEHLKARPKTLAFQCSLVPELKKLVQKAEIQKTGKILEEIKKYINTNDNVGFKSLENFISKNNLLLEDIYKAKPLWKSFPGAVTDAPKWIVRSLKSIFGGKEAKEQIQKIRDIEAAKNQLIGYFMEVEKHQGDFENIFSGKNFEKLKTYLIKGNKHGLQEFLSKNKVSFLFSKNSENNSRYVLSGEEGFNYLKVNLINIKNPQEFLEGLKKNYINNTINDKDMSRVGKFIPNYGNNEGQLINRVISGGFVAGLFISNDFYNHHMLNKDDTKGAKKEWVKRFSQQSSRIWLDAYNGYLLNTTFQRITNKSLPFTVFLGVANSLLSNVLSRIFNGIKLLPVDPKTLDNRPYVVKAKKLKSQGLSGANLKNTYNNSVSSKKYKNSKLSFSGNPNGVINSARKFFKNADAALAKNNPALMSFKEFKESYSILEKIAPEHYKKVLENTWKSIKFSTGKNGITIDELQKFAESNQGNVILGPNSLYRHIKGFIKIFTFPYDILYGIGRRLLNLVRKVLGKELIDPRKESRFSNEIFVKNLFNFANTAKKKANFNKPITEASDEVIHNMSVLFGDNFRAGHNTNVMDYSQDQLSNCMKPIGFVSIPFLGIDTYNKSAKETKNKKAAEQKARERVVQDTTRQIFSFWAVKSFNEIFKGLANLSLAGAALVSFMEATLYESLARLFVGQPLTLKNHKEMVKIEKERLKNQNWLQRALGKKIKLTGDKVIIEGTKLYNPDFNPQKRSYIQEDTKIGRLYRSKFANDSPPVRQFKLPSQI